MKKILITSGLFFIFCVILNAQSLPPEPPFECGVMEEEAEEQWQINALQYSSDFSFYNNLRSWIPYCNQGEPLKNPPLTEIEVAFHVFFDDSGQNNVYSNTQEGKNKLIQLLNGVNNIYGNAGYGPSDPVTGVVELPNYDTKIRFTLGNDNERIYFYNNTTLNHGGDSYTLENFIKNNYPSRYGKLNIYLVGGFNQGRVLQENIEITNAGSGYTSEPTISFNPSSAKGSAVIKNGSLDSIIITNIGAYYGLYPPLITINGGGGSGAAAIVTKLQGGASASANTPSMTLSRNQYVVRVQSHQYEFPVCILAHELAHNLGLVHTYCGGYSDVVCCNDNSCEQGCTQSCNNEEYLSDVFGNCPGTCPHNTGWYLPTADDPKHTNNIVGGTSYQTYISPMQAGQMHRSLALKSMRKYVKKETYSSIPYSITNNELWDFNLKLYRDVHILNGAVLTISNTFELPYNGKIIVEDGAALVISGVLKLSDNNQIIVKSGGSIKLSSSSTILIDNSGKLEILSGAYFCIESGSAITLLNYNSVINLRDGYINGVNTLLLPTTTCITNPMAYMVTGNGKINEFNQDVYIQNEAISSNRYLAGKNIYIGKSVITTEPTGDVIITNNANVIFDAAENVYFEPGFECELGSTFEVVKD